MRIEVGTNGIKINQDGVLTVTDTLNVALFRAPSTLTLIEIVGLTLVLIPVAGETTTVQLW